MNQIFNEYRDSCITKDKYWEYGAGSGVDLHIGHLEGDPALNRLLLGDLIPHCLVGGGIGSGKTTIISQIVQMAMLKYHPNTLKFIFADNDGCLQPYTQSGLPHVHKVFDTSAKDYGVDLFTYLYDLVKNRVDTLINVGAISLYEHNKKMMDEGRPNAALPRIVCVIDDIEYVFLKASPTGRLKIKALLDKFIRLAEYSGVHLLVTAQNIPLEFTPEISKAFNLRIVGRCSEKLSNALLGTTVASEFERNRGKVAVRIDDDGIQLWDVPVLTPKDTLKNLEIIKTLLKNQEE